MKNENLKFCFLILLGARGDLRQNDSGGFYYHAGLPPEGRSAELIALSYDARGISPGGMRLTPAGADFILENLYSERTPRETAALRKLAKG